MIGPRDFHPAAGANLKRFVDPDLVDTMEGEIDRSGVVETASPFGIRVNVVRPESGDCAVVCRTVEIAGQETRTILG